MPDRRTVVRPRWTALLVVAAALSASGALLAQEKEGGGYGDTPGRLVPYRGAGGPARRFFTDVPAFRGPGREDPAPERSALRIGVVTALSGPDRVPGLRMLRGVEMAVAEANAAGGFGERKLPFEVVAVDEGVQWGQAGDAAVDLVTRHDVLAIVGAYEDANSHVLTRVILKLQVPEVITAGVDPTLTEHRIPWLVRVRPDDRQTGYRLARKVFEEDGRSRVVLFRSNDRYGRAGVQEFVDAARRLGHPVPLEVRFEAQEGDFAARLERIRAAGPDAIVMWGRPGPAGTAVRALRGAGIAAPVYAADRIVDGAFLDAAGAAAEGVVFTYPMDPRTGGPGWPAFQARWRAQHGEEPDATAAYAYDGARMVVEAIRHAGPNRARVRDELYREPTFDGVTGTIRFDLTRNAVREPILGRVREGRFVFGE
jgi:branched-chain amino acid transport system substrate-binding protein